MQGKKGTYADLTGRRFGSLEVLAFSHIRRGLPHWKCRCSCGLEKIVRGQSLTAGRTKSCGACPRRRPDMVKHGLAELPEYRSWKGMIARCTDPKHKSYRGYGGRGITVCDRWQYGENGRSGIECFYEDMPPQPGAGYSLDRINNNGSYNKSNCKWSTRSEQQRNRRPVTITGRAGHSNARRPRGSSGLKGVSWSRQNRKWRAAIKCRCKGIYLGYFDNPQEAAAAYDFAAYILFEELARLNVLGSECTSVSLPERTVTKIVEAYLDEVADIHDGEAE
jgi:hypothetical protein